MADPFMITLVLGGFGPSIAGIIMTYRTQAREGRRCPAPTHRGLSYAQKKRTLP